MPVSFGQIPPSVLLPLFYAEVTQTQEPYSPNLRMCLIGLRSRSSGSAAANQPYLLSGSMATEYFGRGSMLEHMYKYARSNAPFAEIWGVAIPEASTGLPYIFKITCKAGSESTQGVGSFWLHGVQCNYSIGATSSANTIAVNVRNAINGQNTHFTATCSGAVVTVTCRWDGYTGNYLRYSTTGCRGRADLGNKAGWRSRVLLVAAGVQSGQGENDASAAYAVLMERPFDVFVHGMGNSHGMMQRSAAFMDHISGRWSPKLQKYGHVVTAMTSSFQGCFDYLNLWNDPHTSTICYKGGLHPQWYWAAALGGQMVTHWAAPPELSRPLQTLELRGMCQGSEDDESFTRPERQLLLEAGGTTFQVGDDFACRIDRVRTLRKTNVYGDPDPSWADAITMFQSQFFVKSMRARIQGAYPRAALSGSPSGINGFTSAIEVKNVIMHEYKRLQALGLVENFELFAAYLVCERNMTDRNRIDVLMRPDFINQLRVVAALVETHLELDATDPTLLAA